ncbi:four-jointed box protein 1-like [Tachypleus tridentatus]|uniref:four-jointed box protein 1-like n=1 Tax=Tachypleus tridentatus TaxID=6853 RepID=UPI003FD23C54
MRNASGTLNIGVRRWTRSVCLASAGIAFTIGMLLGIFLPVYMFVSSPISGVTVSRKVGRQRSTVERLTQNQSVTQAPFHVVVPSPEIDPQNFGVRKGSKNRIDFGKEEKEDQLYLRVKQNRLSLTNDQDNVFDNGGEKSPSTTYFANTDFSESYQKNKNRSVYFPTRTLKSENNGVTNSNLIEGFIEVLHAETNKVTNSMPTEGQNARGGQTVTTVPHVRLLTAAKQRSIPWVSVPTENKISLGNSVHSLSQTLAAPAFPSLPIPVQNLGYSRSEFRKVTNIVSGIYWAEELEKLIPSGFSEGVDSWHRFVNKTRIVKVSEGCGRMQNRLVTFDNGNKSCCRYRQNNDQIQGEIFSFYLSRLLNIENLPPSMLAVIRGQEWQWEHVLSQLHLAQWNVERPIVLTKYIDNLVPAFIPPAFRTKDRQLLPVAEDLCGKTLVELVELAQWSDLIVFDYLTANLDRVVNNMYNEQWNSEMMNSPTHNLAKHKQSGLLVFLDNESGLLHGYRLLDKYEHFHRSLLDSLCVFRRRTAKSIAALHKAKNIGELLKQSFLKYDPGMSDWLPFLPERSSKTLRKRIDTVYNQIRQCEERFNPVATEPRISVQR